MLSPQAASGSQRDHRAPAQAAAVGLPSRGGESFVAQGSRTVFPEYHTETQRRCITRSWAGASRHAQATYPCDSPRVHRDTLRCCGDTGTRRREIDEEGLGAPIVVVSAALKRNRHTVLVQLAAAQIRTGGSAQDRIGGWAPRKDGDDGLGSRVYTAVYVRMRELCALRGRVEVVTTDSALGSG